MYQSNKTKLYYFDYCITATYFFLIESPSCPSKNTDPYCILIKV